MRELTLQEKKRLYTRGCTSGGNGWNQLRVFSLTYVVQLHLELGRSSTKSHIGGFACQLPDIICMLVALPSPSHPHEEHTYESSASGLYHHPGAPRPAGI